MEQQFRISRISLTSTRYPEVLELRNEILRKPLGRSLYSEDRSRDNSAETFIGEIDNQIVACLLLNEREDGKVQLRAMAVAGDWQGKGLGRILVSAAEAYCKENGVKGVILHARKVAKGFYETMGYRVCSDEFTEVGIPHFVMEKEL